MPEKDNVLPISAVEFDPQNARKRTERSSSMIKDSLQKFGPLRSLVGQKLPDGRIIVRAGNGTLEEAGQIGIDKVRVVERKPDELIVVVADDLDESQWKSYAIADNRTSDLSEWDDAVLQELAQDVNLDAWFNPEEMAGWDVDLANIELLDSVEPLTKSDKIPENVETRCNKGEIWQLGRHRLMCGDSTAITDIDRLIEVNSPDVVLIDPPYEKEELYDVIPLPSNEIKKLIVFWDFKRFARASIAATEKGWNPLYELVWDNVTSWYTPNRPLARHKSCGIFGDDPYWDFDNAIIHDGKKRTAKTVFNSRGSSNYIPLDGAVHLRTVEAFPTTAENGGHPHSKPVNWLSAIISGVNANIVLDLFAGSGASFIACENTGRTCYGMELNEKYCDVIIKRWENHTGNVAEIIAK